MCGFAGVVRAHGLRPGDEAAVRAMTRALRHRGPDDEGLFVTPRAAIGHRRLAVVDTSAAARQPMPDGRSPGAVLAYNGEVYNQGDLRRELERTGQAFRSHGDTEVVLRALGAWGADALPRLEGMFALARWDEGEGTLLLARDRFGEKPLFWRRLGGPGGADDGVAFASEASALLHHPEQPRALDRLAIAKYLAFDAFPGEDTALEGVRKLRPGHALAWGPGGLRVWPWFRRRYAMAGDPGPDAEEAAALVWRLLVTSVERRLMSDVPLGLFLSGGVDSSAVLAAMAEVVPAGRIEAFSIGFREASFDESAVAARTAARFGARHRVETLEADALLDLIPDVIDRLDLPLADASVLPTYALCRLARRHVTVALGGDGGDELFAGYDTFLAERLARPLARGPAWLRRGLGALARAIPASDRRDALRFRAERFAQGLVPDPLERHQRWFGAFQPEEAAALLRLGPAEASRVYEDLAALAPGAGEQAALELWTGTYLPEDVLTKVDRASMAVSLEVRAPFLDAELAAFVMGLPYQDKVRGLERKWLLRRALRGRIPDEVLDRPKQGFGAPVATWLRGPLRPEVERLLAPGRLAAQGLLDPAGVDRVVRGHLGGRDLRKQLWALWVLARWCEVQGLA